MTTFISYASKWDMHKGAVSICDLSTAQQNKIIKMTLDPEADIRQFTIDHNIIKKQIDGLWSLIVYVGMELERQKVISSFESRDTDDIDTIVQFFSETKLGERLRDALNFDNQSSEPLFYDWTELESIKIEILTEVMNCPLTKVKAHLFKHISTVMEELKHPQPKSDLSPIQPSFIEKIVDLFYFICNRKKYDFRILDRKITPYRIKYVQDVEQEIKITMGDETWPLFLHAQASDINFLKATYLLYETGFLAQIPPQGLVSHVVHGLYIYSTKSKSSGTLSILTAIDKVKTACRK